MKISDILNVIIKKRVNISEIIMTQTYKDWMLNYGRYKDFRFKLTEEEYKVIYDRMKGK